MTLDTDLAGSGMDMELAAAGPCQDHEVTSGRNTMHDMGFVSLVAHAGGNRPFGDLALRYNQVIDRIPRDFEDLLAGVLSGWGQK